MPHRITGLTGGVLWLAGATSFLISRVVLWGQTAISDPGSLTDAAGSGGIAVTTAGALITGFQTAKYLIPLILDSLKAAREERDRARNADAVKLAQDERFAALEADAKAARAKADRAHKHIAILEGVVDEARERRHIDANEVNRAMLAVLAQVRDNTTAVNLIVAAMESVSRRVDEPIELPAPVESLIDDIPPPIPHIVPTARESAQSEPGG